MLSHGQVLEVRQGDGTYVRTNIDPAEVMRRVRAFGLRHFAFAVLETEAARLTAIASVQADVGLLRRAVEGPRRAGQRIERGLCRPSSFPARSPGCAATAAPKLAWLYRYFANSVRMNTLTALKDKELPEPGLATLEGDRGCYRAPG